MTKYKVRLVFTEEINAENVDKALDYPFARLEKLIRLGILKSTDKRIRVEAEQVVYQKPKKGGDK